MRCPRFPPSYSVGEFVGNSIEFEPEARVVRLGGVFDVIEHKELSLGTEEDRVANACGLHHALGFFGDAARVAVVRLAGGRLEHVTDQRHSGLGKERIDAGGRRIRHQIHVQLVDRFPTSDRRAVKHLALGKGFFFDHGDVEGDVLPLAARVGKSEIDVLHVVILDQLHDFFSCRHGTAFPLVFMKLPLGRLPAA